MSINLEQKTTYPIRLGSTIVKNTSESSQVADSGTFEEDGFHLVSRQLPRSTTKLSRETLESGENARARHLDTTRPGPSQVLIEIDGRDQKSTCTYEGDYEPVALKDEGQSDDDVECVLIYDEESKAFVIDRVASHVAVKTGAPSGVSSVAATSTGQLALPVNRHVASRRGTPDEASDDELAKELEGMLDDVSDPGDARKTSVPRASAAKWDSLDDQLNMELAETLDDALLDAASDDDEFEEVDGAQFLDDAKDLDVESLPDRSDDDDMVFEEVDPGADAPSAPLSLSVARGDDFGDFEEIGTPLTGQSNGTSGIDDSLFSGSASPALLSPRRSEQRGVVNQARRSRGSGLSADVDTETLDGFEDLDLDLTRSLEDE
ncbi:hypothetical protein H4S07_001988 [Coemansia furcata]|uniref:Uncharacterized protein n=1 Tax=Coemansia furcata TaxID=417177 RepID=A0ACC1LM31_9FUNG|nr:hypothetical protein H4S07_001988 [Coemansia furcata]